ncbi:membrane protein [Mycobacterium phage ScoobyDoobyDoo]|nr:membrane protein [Mycobacterium phage ScoobyDoobyDoo]
MAKWKNPLADTKPTTVGLFLLVCLWALFQWRDPTPPPVLDQILVASFGVWFANEAIDKKNSESKKDSDGRSEKADSEDGGG